MLNDVWKQLKDNIFKASVDDIKLDFTSYPNNLLGRFDRVLNNTNCHKLTFEYTVYSYLISNEITITMDFVADSSNRLNNAHLDNFEVKTEDGIIFWLVKKSPSAESIEKKRQKEKKEQENFEKTGKYVSFGLDFGQYDTYYIRMVNANLIKQQFVDFSIFYALVQSYRDNDDEWDWHNISDEEYEKKRQYIKNQIKVYSETHKLSKSRWADINNAHSKIVCPFEYFDVLEKVRTDGTFFYMPIFETLDKIKKDEIQMYADNDNVAEYIQECISKLYKVPIDIVKQYVKEVVSDFIASDADCFSTYFKKLESDNFNSAFFGCSYGDKCGHLVFPGFLDFGDVIQPNNDLKGLWESQYNSKFAKTYIILMYWNQKIDPKQSKYYRLITDTDMAMYSEQYFRHQSAEMLKTFLEDILEECLNPSFGGTMYYVGSSRATIKRLYHLDKKDDFTLLLKKYMENKADNKFINKWIKKFGIGDSISFDIDDDGVGVKIRLYKTPNDEEGRLLADEGYGITQLLSIMLQIEMSEKYRGITIAVEEPEIHLHPKYQSLLADMFVDAYKEREIHFIIETHSEYLIRRLQLLVAGIETEKKLDKNEVSIAYIYTKDEAEKENQPLVKNISICEDGYLDDTFGSGFFDEATKLSRKLM